MVPEMDLRHYQRGFWSVTIDFENYFSFQSISSPTCTSTNLILPYDLYLAKLVICKLLTVV